MDVLIIEDDPLICRTIRNGWPTPGDELHFVSSYGQSIGVILSPELALFDAVVIDLHLPDGNGLSILRSIRSNSNVPVLMISGSGSPESRAGTLDVGADDYLMKPFVVRELQARVARQVAARIASHVARPEVPFRIGAVECDLQARTLALADERQALTDAEARLLAFLRDNAGRNCAKAAIYKHAFYRKFNQGEKSLDVYVWRIRQKLGKLSAESAARLQTARGAGYRLEIDET